MVNVDSESAPSNGQVRKRTRRVRSYPAYTLENTINLSTAVQEANAGLPFDRVLLAEALRTTPSSSAFNQRLNSSAGYGLTQGGYNDELISLTSLGEAFVAPQDPDEKRKALVEAALHPEPFRRFYELLSGKKVPDNSYAENVLRRELGIPPDLTSDCLRTIKANGLFTGIISKIHESLYVTLSAAKSEGDGQTTPYSNSISSSKVKEPTEQTSQLQPQTRGRIFIGHAGSGDMEAAVTEMLDSFGILSTSAEPDPEDTRPLSVDVLETMRHCTAAIIIIAAPRTGPWSGSHPQTAIASLLSQLGAATSLYQDKVVLLTETELASTVQWDGLDFRREEPKELSFPLMVELHRLGVIQVHSGS